MGRGGKWVDWSLHFQLKVRKARCYSVHAQYCQSFQLLKRNQKNPKFQMQQVSHFFKKNTPIKANILRKQKQIQPTICQVQPLLGPLIFNISKQNKSLFQRFLFLLSAQLVHPSKFLFVLLLTF